MILNLTFGSILAGNCKTCTHLILFQSGVSPVALQHSVLTLHIAAPRLQPAMAIDRATTVSRGVNALLVGTEHAHLKAVIMSGLMSMQDEADSIERSMAFVEHPSHYRSRLLAEDGLVFAQSVGTMAPENFAPSDDAWDLIRTGYSGINPPNEVRHILTRSHFNHFWIVAAFSRP